MKEQVHSRCLLGNQTGWWVQFRVTFPFCPRGLVMPHKYCTVACVRPCGILAAAHLGMGGAQAQAGGVQKALWACWDGQRGRVRVCGNWGWCLGVEASGATLSVVCSEDGGAQRLSHVAGHLWSVPLGSEGGRTQSSGLEESGAFLCHWSHILHMSAPVPAGLGHLPLTGHSHPLGDPNSGRGAQPCLAASPEGNPTTRTKGSFQKGKGLLRMLCWVNS